MENKVSFYKIVSWVKDAFHPKSEAFFPFFNRRGVGRSHYPCGVASVVQWLPQLPRLRLAWTASLPNCGI
jgi:hypothetical protein